MGRLPELEHDNEIQQIPLAAMQRLYCCHQSIHLRASRLQLTAECHYPHGNRVSGRIFGTSMQFLQGSEAHWIFRNYSFQLKR